MTADDTTQFDKHRARFAARRAAAAEQSAPHALPPAEGTTGVVVPGADALIPLTGDQVRLLDTGIVDAITAHLQPIPNFHPQRGSEYLLDQSYLIHAARRRDNDPAVSHHFVKAELLSQLHDLIMEEFHYGSRRVSKADILRKVDVARERVEYGVRSVGGMEKILPGGAEEFGRVVDEFTAEVQTLCQQVTARHAGSHEL